MSQEGSGKLRNVRAAILLVALALTVIGVLFVHSTTSYDDSFPSPLARKQIIRSIIALLAFGVVTRIHYRSIERFAYLMYGGLIAVLLVMLAAKAGRQNRFLETFLFQIQPSELMKIAVILALARYLRYRKDQGRILGLSVPLVLTVVPMVLVLLQPDLGTSLMLPAILLGMLLVAGAKPRYLAVAVIIGASTVPAAYFLRNQVDVFKPYQLRRIEAFMNQGAETLRAEDAHLHQSLITIGSGGATGKGYGKGTQNKLLWLPEKDTDFIYSVIAEEWGFVGAASVAFLFLILVVLILRVALLTREPFGRLAVTGVGIAFAAQSIENMGMTMGLLPITGIPLPFVSYGGSSLVTSYMALAVAFNVASRRMRVVATADLVTRDDKDAGKVVPEASAALLQNRWPTR